MPDKPHDPGCAVWEQTVDSRARQSGREREAANVSALGTGVAEAPEVASVRIEPNKLFWSRAGEVRLWAASVRLPGHGLRWKFNAILLPLVAATVILLVWLDYRHEWHAIMGAYEQHAAAVNAGAAAGPVDRGPSPEAIASRTLAIHAVYAVVLLSLVALGLNIALWRFVLRPIDRIRERIEHMEHGHWRMPVQPAGYDEVGRVVDSFQMLGPKVDALVMQLLRAERLATLALVANKAAAELEPLVQRVAAAVRQLRQSSDDEVRGAAQEIARANAEILAVVRGLDRPFEASLRMSRKSG